MTLLIIIIIGIIIYFAIKSAKRQNKMIDQVPSTPAPKVFSAPTLKSGSTTNNSNLTYLQRGSVDLSSQRVQDDLATFTILVGRPESKSSNKSAGRWVRNGEQISINSYTTTRGFFYFGGQLKAYNTNAYYNVYETEASLVDETLLIEKQEKSYTDETLNYWPKFIELSPKARGAYIDWLFGDRSDIETPIGYVFIYFYGLERRIIIDGSNEGDVADSEYLDLFHEIKRLRETFFENYAFKNYSTKLIELMAYLRPEIIKMDYDIYSSGHNALLFKYNLAKTVQDGMPISAELALQWIRYSDQYNLRTPARRCEDEFSILFKMLYLKKNNEGIIVKPNKTKLNLEYYPASSSLRGFMMDQLDLPDPSILKAPIKKIIPIADQCTSDLEAYSRYLGRKGTKKTDFEAIVLLPEALKNSYAEKMLTSFKEWAEEKIVESNGLVLFSELWTFTGKLIPEKLTKKELNFLDEFLSLSNYFCVPNPQIHNVKPQVDGCFVISHAGISSKEQITDSFKNALLYIRLAIMVAKSDHVLHENENNLLSEMIDEDLALSHLERASLHAYSIWSLNSPINLTGLKQQIDNISESSKAVFRKSLVQIVLADGKVEASEIKQLEKIYTMLGIDKGLIPSDLHQLATIRSSKNIANKPKDIRTESFILDKSLLAQHEAETKEVHALLGSIFVEEDVHEDKIEILAPLTLESLDNKHSELFEILITKDKWLREEVVTLCQRIDLMVDGAIDTINDWAYETVDAPVLGDDGDIYVDQEIVVELKGE